MQRRQRCRFATPPHRWHHRLRLLAHVAHQLLLAGDWQLPRFLVCAIMGHQKDLLSVLPRSFERIVLLFFPFGNLLSYFVGVNGLYGRPRWGSSSFDSHDEPASMPPRATIKALPTASHHPRPYGRGMSLS